MEDIPIDQMDIKRLRAELSSAWTANRLLNEMVTRLKSEVRTLQKARGREKYTLRQKQKNAERLDAQIKKLRMREQKLDALEAAGVDNWEGYDYAMELLQEDKK